MNFEYLILNLIILILPFFSKLLYPKIYYPISVESLIAISLPTLIFIFHDQVVTNKWWFFNRKYILGIKIFKLPIEEIIFFATVGFSCLTIWINLKYLSFNYEKSTNIINLIFFSSVILTYLVVFIKSKKPYPGLVFFFFTFLVMIDSILKTKLIFSFRFLIFTFLVIGLTIVFNFYLTTRPVVIYKNKYLSGLRLKTIPIEDFLYGINFTYLITILFEFLTR